MSTSILIVVAFIALSFAYMFWMKSKQAKQAETVSNADFEAESANAGRYKTEVLEDELPYVVKAMDGEKIDAFTYANNPQSIGSALKDGLKDRLKGAATLGTVRFTTMNTAKYLVLSGDKLHLLDTDTDGEISEHLVFGAERLRSSSLTEIQLEGQERTAAVSRGNNIKGYRLSLHTDGKPIELTLYSCLIFTSIPEMPSDPHDTVKAIVIATDFIKRLGGIYPNLKA